MPLAASDVILGDVAAALTGWTGESTTVLVVQLDEFQRQEALVRDICNAIDKHNLAQPVKGCLIMPILTGLPTEVYGRVEDIATDASHQAAEAIYLSYITAEGKSAADDVKTWHLVCNATRAVLTHMKCPLELLLPTELKDLKSEVLRYLVQDLSGWPLGAVRLGGALASVMASEGVANADKLTFAQLQEVEKRMDEALSTTYASSTTALAKMLGSAGLFKVCALLCGPFPVRLWGVGREKDGKDRAAGNSHSPPYLCITTGA